MSGIKTLAGDTMIYGLSTILTRMLNYLITPYLTRVMVTGEYGVVTDIYSIIPFVLVLLTMGLESGYFRFAGKAENEVQKRRVFVAAFTATVVAAAAFFVVGFALRDSIASAMGYGDNPWLVTLMLIIIMLDVMTALPFARLREQRRRMRYVGVRLASVVMNLALCLLFYSVLPGLAEGGAGGVFADLWDPGFGAGYVLVANVVASATSAMLLIPTMKGIGESFDRMLLRRIMLYSLPLLVSGIAGTAGEFIDRQMIKWLMPPDVAMGALGVYGATTKLAVIMILFTQMYRLAAEPFFLARFGKKGDFARQSALATWLYIAVAALIFAGVMIFKPVIMLILGEDFREGNHLLPILLGANALAGVVFNLSLWYKQAERTWMAIAVTGTGLAVTLMLNFALVPRMGYEGAAWARLGCEAAMVAVSLGLVMYNRKKIMEL